MWSSVRNEVGENFYPKQPNSAINGMSAMDFFLLMYTPRKLVAMVDLINIELEKLEANTTNTLELLKFFGVLILMTSFEFTSRASLWSSVAPTTYQPAPHFGLTGMLKHRFDDLFRAIRWSTQPIERAENKVLSSIGGSWWMTSSQTSKTTMQPILLCPTQLCRRIHEPLVQPGGHWINHSLPQNWGDVLV
jgi:hypothetical protein